MAIRLGDIALAIGAELHGDPDCPISGVATLDTAKPGDLAFLYNRAYRGYLQVTAASAVILVADDVADCPVASLVTANPYLGYARAAGLLCPPPTFAPGRHPSAVIAEDAVLAPTVYVGPHAVIESKAELGEHVVIGPNCVVGTGVRLGAYTRLVASVTVLGGTSIGSRCILHPGAVIGADGFGLARDQGTWVKIPQIGGVSIGDDVEIGANTSIDRGALKDTIIEDGVKLDNQIQVGHNCHIGAHAAVAGCAGISGSTKIGKRSIIGGGAGIAGHIEIADDVTVKAAASVTKSIRKAGVYSSVWPAKEDREWKKRVARLQQLAVRAERDSRD
jgi:UDP-3-O-[3-hydroxymyristoyl] glucosamine N-acyltransferase